jgi:archaemetzincin
VNDHVTTLRRIAFLKNVIPLIVVFTLAACGKDYPLIRGNISLNVALQPFGAFDPKLSDSIAVTLERAYGVKTIILKDLDLPKSAFVNMKSPRYRADSLLRHLMNIKPDTIDYVIGLTTQDVSTTKRDESGVIKSPEEKYKDWGVLGLGYRPGPSCIISTYRIAHKSRSVFMARLKKIAIHELGHNLGLDHCETNDCVMQDAAETIKTIDRSHSGLCESCKNKLGIQ